MTRTFFVIVTLALAALTIAACYDYETDLRACETSEQCADESKGDLDYCGQGGQDLCCSAGGYECGCIPDDSCADGYQCFNCSDSFCVNGQPTICLDSAGDVLGLERRE